MRHIAVVNQSKRLTNAEVAIMTEACNVQVYRHAAPAWGKLPMHVGFYLAETMVPKDADPIVIFDSPDEADALGYHSETPDGKVYGKVFVDPVLDNRGAVMKGGLSVSAVLSHEVLEQFVDPDCNLWADGGDGKLYAIEVADPVEADAYTITVAGKKVAVSNFVFPEWFDKENRPGARFDYMKVLKKPFTMSKGGYMIVMRAGKEESVFAAKYPKWRMPGKKHAASRTFRRTPK